LPTPPPTAVSPGVSGGSERILLVEDEPAVRDMTRRILERAGYQVVVAEDGDAALATVDRSTVDFDVLVTDVVMPGTSGIELAERVLDRSETVGVVLLSGYTAETLDLERLLARGARFVAKPVATSELLRAIRDADAVGRANR
ncbi:MAG TPA: response regulator, partial [Candidatus Limnocylindrales bacterium]